PDPDPVPDPDPTPEPDPAPEPDPEPQPDPEPDPDPAPEPDPEPEPAPNTAPTLSGTPPTSVVVGSAYRFAPEASDADGDVLQFEIENEPAWTSFDASTGVLTGTPQEEDVG